jgi:hypothetical protein
MLDHAHETIALAQGKTREDLDNNRIFELAQTRLLESLGKPQVEYPLNSKESILKLSGGKLSVFATA